MANDRSGRLRALARRQRHHRNRDAPGFATAARRPAHRSRQTWLRESRSSGSITPARCGPTTRSRACSRTTAMTRWPSASTEATSGFIGRQQQVETALDPSWVFVAGDPNIATFTKACAARSIEYTMSRAEGWSCITGPERHRSSPATSSPEPKRRPPDQIGRAGDEEQQVRRDDAHHHADDQHVEHRGRRLVGADPSEMPSSDRATPVVNTIPDPTTSNQNGIASPDQSSSCRTADADVSSDHHDHRRLHRDRTGTRCRSRGAAGGTRGWVPRGTSGRAACRPARSRRRAPPGRMQPPPCPTPPSDGPKAAARLRDRHGTEADRGDPHHPARDVGHHRTEERIREERHREGDRPVEERRLCAARQGRTQQRGPGRQQRLDEQIQRHQPGADERGAADESAPDLADEIHRVCGDRRPGRDLDEHDDRGDRGERRQRGCVGHRPILRLWCVPHRGRRRSVRGVAPGEPVERPNRPLRASAASRSPAGAALTDGAVHLHGELHRTALAPRHRALERIQASLQLA